MGLLINGLSDLAKKYGFRVVEEYKKGVSGATVIKVETPQGFLVFKSHPTRTKNELIGYQLLSNTLYKKHLPVLISKYSGKNRIAYEYCEGESLRNALKYNLLLDDVIFKTFKYCLGFMLKTWSDPKLKDLNNAVTEKRSIQREEWGETCVLIDSVINNLSVDLNISKDRFIKSKVTINGQDYGSFNEAFTNIKKLILSKVQSKNLILAHGDLTTSNVIVNYPEIKFIDLEWMGLHDIAEIFAKVARVKVAHLSQLPVKAEIAFDKKRGILISIDDLSIPKIAIKMQDYAINNLSKYENKLNLGGFRKRVLTYMAGFSLRDMALSSKRGGRSDEIYALANTLYLAGYE